MPARFSDFATYEPQPAYPLMTGQDWAFSTQRPANTPTEPNAASSAAPWLRDWSSLTARAGESVPGQIESLLRRQARRQQEDATLEAWGVGGAAGGSARLQAQLQGGSVQAAAGGAADLARAQFAADLARQRMLGTAQWAGQYGRQTSAEVGLAEKLAGVYQGGLDYAAQMAQQDAALTRQVAGTYSSAASAAIAGLATGSQESSPAPAPPPPQAPQAPPPQQQQQQQTTQPPPTATSDRRAKTGVREVEAPSAWLRSVEPVTYRYRAGEAGTSEPGMVPPDWGEHRLLGVLAQDLRKSRVGRSMLHRREDGALEISIPAAIGPILAALADHERRLSSK